MTQLPKLQDIIRDRGLWSDIAGALHWESETTEASRPYKRWIGENSHLHSYTEIGLCVAGNHSYGVGGKAIKLSPGSAFLIPKQVLHDNWYGEHHSPCVDFWLYLLPHGHVTMNFVEHQPGVALSQTSLAFKDADLLADCERACFLLDAEETPSHKTTSYLFYLLHCILEKLANGEVPKADMDENLTIAHIKEHIAKNLADRLTLEELARVAGYSPFHFHRVFTKAVKMTPRNFIETHRIKFACKLLEAGQSITSAAFESGFSTCSQFNRVFKKHIKSSPSQWLKRRKS